jgi:hypothetical protein
LLANTHAPSATGASATVLMLPAMEEKFRATHAKAEELVRRIVKLDPSFGGPYITLAYI